MHLIAFSASAATPLAAGKESALPTLQNIPLDMPMMDMPFPPCAPTLTPQRIFAVRFDMPDGDQAREVELTPRRVDERRRPTPSAKPRLTGSAFGKRSPDVDGDHHRVMHLSS
jgi:hypothetical protein